MSSSSSSSSSASSSSIDWVDIVSVYLGTLLDADQEAIVRQWEPFFDDMVRDMYRRQTHPDQTCPICFCTPSIKAMQFHTRLYSAISMSSRWTRPRPPMPVHRFVVLPLGASMESVALDSVMAKERALIQWYFRQRSPRAPFRRMMALWMQQRSQVNRILPDPRYLLYTVLVSLGYFSDPTQLGGVSIHVGAASHPDVAHVFADALSQSIYWYGRREVNLYRVADIYFLMAYLLQQQSYTVLQRHQLRRQWVELQDEPRSPRDPFHYKRCKERWARLNEPYVRISRRDAAFYVGWAMSLLGDTSHAQQTNLIEEEEENKSQ